MARVIRTVAATSRCFVLLLAGLSTGTPASAKTLVFCSEGNPESLSPQIATTAMGTNAARPMFDNLVQFKPGTSEIVPDLAESWTISPDGTEYVFHLRHGVKFHSRDRFTPTRFFNADDVLFSFFRQWRVDHPYHAIAKGSFDYFADLGMADLLKGIDKIDDYTVRFRLTRPESPFITDLAMPFTMVLSAEYADAMAKAGTPERLDVEPIGTGPFMFDSYQPDVALHYSAFQDYWAGKPAIDTLVYSITPNVSVRFTKLKAGECQIMSLPSPSDAARIADDPHLTLMRQDGLNISYLAMNASIPPFNDERVRRAVVMAIDKTTLVPAIYGGGGRAIKNPLPPQLWSYNEAVRDQVFDVAAAQKLMVDAGLGQGFDTDLWYMPVTRPYNPDSKRMAEMIAEDLSQIGIRTKLVTTTWTDYSAKLQAGVAPMAIYGWIGDNGDPDNFLSILLGCHGGKPGPNNITKWCDADYDTLMNQGTLVTDRPAREAIYRQAQMIIRDKVPLMPIAQSSVLMAVRSNVRGFTMDPFGRYLFDTVDLDGL